MSKQIFDALKKNQQEPYGDRPRVEAFAPRAMRRQKSRVYAKRAPSPISTSTFDKCAPSRARRHEGLCGRSAAPANCSTAESIQFPEAGRGLMVRPRPVETDKRGVRVDPPRMRPPRSTTYRIRPRSPWCSRCVLTYSRRALFPQICDDCRRDVVFLIVAPCSCRGRDPGAARSHRHRGDRRPLPKRVNHVRILLVDAASLAFCGYFAWNRSRCCMRRS